MTTPPQAQHAAQKEQEQEYESECEGSSCYSGQEEDEQEFEDDDEEEGHTLAELLCSLLATEDGVNVVDALQGIQAAVEKNTKVLYKVATTLELIARKQ